MELNRRQFLLGGGAVALAALTPGAGSWASNQADKAGVRELTARLSGLDLGDGKAFKAWSFNGGVPGPVIRAELGERIRVKLVNQLPEPTTIHWHGLPVPNPMDGVPGVTQKPTQPGASYLYEFTAKPAGTYIYHSHQGLQLDRGLFGALVIDDPGEARDYDREFVLVLEDWVARDGGGPEASRRKPAGGMMGGGRGMMGRQWGARAGGPPEEPVYDAFAVNGRAYPHTKPLPVKEGQRIRLRICNASASTIYDLRLAGHALTITHSDGQAIKPIAADVLRIGMGERYDVQFVADNPGNWLLGAYDSGWGESGLKVPVVYEGHQDRPQTEPQFPRGLRYPGYWDFESARPLQSGAGRADRRYNQVLSGGMHSPLWTINGYAYPRSEILNADLGQTVRFSYTNHSHMAHPMHLHGHFFRVINPALPPERWIVKDTLIVDPCAGWISSSPPTIPAAGCTTATISITWRPAWPTCCRWLELFKIWRKYNEKVISSEWFTHHPFRHRRKYLCPAGGVWRWELATSHDVGRWLVRRPADDAVLAVGHRAGRTGPALGLQRPRHSGRWPLRANRFRRRSR